MCVCKRQKKAATGSVVCPSISTPNTNNHNNPSHSPLDRTRVGRHPFPSRASSLRLIGLLLPSLDTHALPSLLLRRLNRELNGLNISGPPFWKTCQESDLSGLVRNTLVRTCQDLSGTHLSGKLVPKTCQEHTCQDLSGKLNQ